MGNTNVKLPPAYGLHQATSAAVERDRARQQDVEQHPRRPYVHRFAVLSLLYYLRGHKMRTAYSPCNEYVWIKAHLFKS